jgi:ketohexokinase
VLTVLLHARSTVGAGDTFIAGMLYGLHADGWSPEATLAFAVELATKKVQREGFAGLTV